ncbi:hypothetical protein [Raoultella planticola]|uniref:Uncharacterized protein n=1 Tax=Raoultella planticola TaxID=575 RepID=A0ABU5M5A6_RAOPL|nr:hypothetical protein [Raoultella planticola]MDW4553460.1 hypothetical protein [Raoultella planticola]MDZ7446641.1 hypothetical protein [Raoultella planticola]MDZ7467387.1 hypothetical protein [Raoultella planticola]MDZ7508454.1 hypothetical protein [Raoultella planticola]MEA5396619.1 hypothetical protein [Raoultella planticola]
MLAETVSEPQEVVLAVSGEAKPEVLIDAKRIAPDGVIYPRTIAIPRMLSNTQRNELSPW